MNVSCAYNPWLHRYAVVVLVATLIQICSGGLVTSHEAGMAVPDWPNTFGYNMFLFPVEHWVGLVFYEHSHRLIGAGLGLLTIGLTLLIFLLDSRRLMRVLGIVALIGVCAQGVMGGLRVRWAADYIGIFHACTAQLFLVLIATICLFTSRWWLEKSSRLLPLASRSSPTLHYWLLASTLLIFIQLTIAATMRHEHIGLAVPDFPTAYGRIIPKTDPESLAQINAERQTRYQRSLTAAAIHLHMMHRFNSMLIFACVVVCARGLARAGFSKVGWIWVGMILAQIGLGAWTVLSQKAADVATMHVALGALIFMLSSLLTIAGFARR